MTRRLSEATFTAPNPKQRTCQTGDNTGLCRLAANPPCKLEEETPSPGLRVPSASRGLETWGPGTSFKTRKKCLCSEPPMGPLVDEWIKKMWPVCGRVSAHTVEYSMGLGNPNGLGFQRRKSFVDEPREITLREIKPDRDRHTT